MKLWLRLPTDLDTAFVWECRNDPTTRAVSIQQEEIPYETHQAWWGRFLKAPDGRLWIATAGEDRLAVGYGRAIWEHDVADISIALHPAARGQGLRIRRPHSPVCEARRRHREIRCNDYRERLRVVRVRGDDPLQALARHPLRPPPCGRPNGKDLSSLTSIHPLSPPLGGLA